MGAAFTSLTPIATAIVASPLLFLRKALIFNRYMKYFVVARVIHRDGLLVEKVHKLLCCQRHRLIIFLIKQRIHACQDLLSLLKAAELTIPNVYLFHREIPT